MEFPFADLRKTEKSRLGKNTSSSVLNLLNLRCLINIQMEIPKKQADMSLELRHKT